MPEGIFPDGVFRNTTHTTTNAQGVDNDCDNEAVVYEEVDSDVLFANLATRGAPMAGGRVPLKTPGTDWVPPAPRKGWRRYRQ